MGESLPSTEINGCLTLTNSLNDSDDEIENKAPNDDDDDPQDNDQDVFRNEKCNRLPQSKIKLIIKTDSDVTICSSDASFLISRATEQFIKFMTKHSLENTKIAARKTIQKKDIDSALNMVDQLMFLDGVL